MIKVIKEKKEWKKTLELMNFDFYHTYDYHILSNINDYEPVLLFYENTNIKIAIPLIIRPIKDSIFFDATSVYGYAGPIMNQSGDFDFDDFRNSFNVFLKKRKIISVFSRLNPFIKGQDEIISGIGDIVELGNLVNIDITQSIDIQKSNFSKTTKRYLNKLQKDCSIVVSKKVDDIFKFIPIYYETMKRVSADKSFFFDEQYFINFIKSKDFQCEIVFAILNETKEIMAGALMVKTQDKIIQYHLSGTRNKFLEKTPLRLIMDHTRIIGTEQGYKYFNLGGGLGNKNDFLLQFKASFSKDYKKFKIWQYIADEKEYEKLCLSVKNANSNDNQIDFFPLYRYDG